MADSHVSLLLNDDRIRLKSLDDKIIFHFRGLLEMDKMK